MLTQIIPSYLYQQYYDDADLQAFVSAYNTLAQDYLDWFNNLNLPIYTKQSGASLDWVAQGIYGLKRPVLPEGGYTYKGVYNTPQLDELPFNQNVKIAPQNFYITTDDIFQRCITWNFYKGDGYQFNTTWLKRRVARFLAGVHGTDPQLGETYQISVTFAANNVVNIHILPGVSIQKGGSLLDTFDLDTVTFNAETIFAALIPTTLAPILQSALNAGVLETPFQYTFNVTY
jgi:hypothetical protein